MSSKKVTATDGWDYEFDNLPKYENGQEISYVIKEDQVADYSTSYNGNSIINTYTPEKTSISVIKAWDDSNNKDKLRPSSIQVQLYTDGEVIGKAIELNSGNKWSTTWQNLSEKANGKIIVYKVKEVGTLNGYTPTIDDSNLGNIIIANHHTPKIPNQSSKPNNPKNNNKTLKKQKPSEPKNKSAKTLPGTGEAKQNILIFIGLIIFLVAAYVLLTVKKEKND